MPKTTSSLASDGLDKTNASLTGINNNTETGKWAPEELVYIVHRDAYGSDGGSKKECFAFSKIEAAQEYLFGQFKKSYDYAIGQGFNPEDMEIEYIPEKNAHIKASRGYITRHTTNVDFLEEAIQIEKLFLDYQDDDLPF